MASHDECLSGARELIAALEAADGRWGYADVPCRLSPWRTHRMARFVIKKEPGGPVPRPFQREETR